MTKEESSEASGSYNSPEPDLHQESPEDISREMFFQLSPDMMSIISASGKFLRLNSAWKKILGYDLDEIVEKSFTDFVHPEDLPVTLKEFAKELTGMASYEFVNRYRCKDGTYKWLEWHSQPAPDKSVIFGIARDITASKLTSEALAESEENFRVISENSNYLLMRFDRSLRHMFVNQAVEKYFGIPRESFIGKNHKELGFPEEVHEYMDLCLEKVFKTGQSHKEVTSINDGKIWFDWKLEPEFGSNGEVKSVVSYSRDITELVQARQAIEESEQKFRTLIDVMGEGVGLTDPEERFLMANRAAEEILRVNPGELVGKSLVEFLNPDQIQQIRQETTLRMEGERSTYELEIRRKDGTTGQILVTATPNFRDGKFIGTIGVFRDVTTQKMVEKVLADKENMYRGMFENHNAVKILMEPESGKIVDANNAAAVFYGYPVDRLKEMNIADLNTKERQEINATLQQISESGQQYFHCSHRLASGEIREVEDYASPLMINDRKVIFSIIHDITERNRFQQALEISEQWFKAIFNEAPYGIAVIDSLNGRVYSVNPMFARIAGRSVEEMLTISWQEITHPDDIREDLDNMALMNEGKINGFTMEKRYIRPDNSYVWINMTVAPLRVKDTSNLRHLCMIEDISERKKKDTEIRETNEALTKAVATKDLFFSIIAHDLRSPFNIFLNGTQLLAENYNSFSAEELLELINALGTTAKKLFKLLENLLEWSKMQRGLISMVPENFTLKPEIVNTLAIVEDLAKNKEISLIIEIPEKLVVTADKKMLESILRNLVSNAIKFTPKGGSVVVTADRSGATFADITVKDNGIGMDSLMLENLFRLDVKTNRPGTEGEVSSGLGLMLVKEFVDKIGGKLKVESVQGIGTTFSFSVPSPENAELYDLPGLSVHKPGGLATGKTLKALVVDDDMAARMILTATLKTEGWEAFQAKNGHEAVAICRNNSSELNLVLMDIDMPEMDGLEAIREIRKFNQEIKIIVQTASSYELNRVLAFEAGCNEYLVKPIKLKEIKPFLKKYSD